MGGYVNARLSLQKHTSDMMVFNIINMLMRGVWGVRPPPPKNLGLNGVKLCNSRRINIKLPFQKRQGCNIEFS